MSDIGRLRQADTPREELIAEIERLREALAWYGEQVGRCRLTRTEGCVARQALHDDYGRRARAALFTEPKTGD